MNARTNHEQIRALGTTAARAAALLTRYPRVSKDESREIMTFLKTARHLDVGRLSSDASIRPRLDAFMEDHKKHLGVTVGEAIWTIGLIAAFLVVCWLLWGLGTAGIG
jgi:hypothetical protein